VGIGLIVATVVGVGEIVERGILLDVALGTTEIGAAQAEMKIIIMKTILGIFTNIPFK
jgi:hypothetical protein